MPGHSSRERRFGAAGFSEGGWQAARAWVRGRTGQVVARGRAGHDAVLVPGGDRSGPVYVATSVGAGRLPLADSTRGGSRDRRFRAAGLAESL